MVPKGVNQEGKEKKMESFMLKMPRDQIRSLVAKIAKDFLLFFFSSKRKEELKWAVDMEDNPCL